MPENWMMDAPPADDLSEEQEQKAVAVRYDVEKDRAPRVMALEIDREIPPELYRTIAEVLAHVYRIDRHMGDRSS